MTNGSNHKNGLELDRSLILVSSSECIAWVAVYGTESVAIGTLNFLAIIVFLRNRSLRKLSMYLVINLAVADMLVGGISEVVLLVILGACWCRVWRVNGIRSSIWADIIGAMWRLFLFASLTNLTAISLERMHATFRPFKHRVIKKWVLSVVITVTWATAGIFATSIKLAERYGLKYIVRMSLVTCSFISICLFIIFVSYASVLVKVCCGAHPRHHGPTSRERKLTKTLFIVTLVSLMTWFPSIVHDFILFNTDIFSSLPFVSYFRLYNSAVVLLFANSLLNPIVYTIRMPEFRRALVSLIIRRQHGRGQVQIPLQNIPFN